MLVLVNLFQLITRFAAVFFRSHDQMSIGNYAFHAIVFNPSIHIALSMDKNLFFPLCIVKSQFVKPFTTFSRVGLDTAQLIVVFVVGIKTVTKVWRHLISVIHAANYDRLIWIAFKKINDHFLTNPWPERCSPALTSPRLCHPHPARTVRIVLAFTVPMKLHLHSSIFIGE